METFKIWSTLNLRGNAINKMAEFAQITSRATLNVAKLDKSLIPLSAKLEKVRLELIGIKPNLAYLSNNFLRLASTSQSSAAGIVKFSESVTSASQRTQSLSRSTNRLAESLTAVAVKGDLAAASIANVQKERIAAAGIGRRSAASSAGYLGGAASLGGVGLGVAAGVGFLTYSGFEQEKEYQQKEGIMRGQGMSNAQLAEAKRITHKSIPGLSPNDIMESLVAAKMATQSWDEAKVLAPTLAMGRFSAKALYGGMTEAQVNDAIRVAEFMGGSDTHKIDRSLNTVFKVMALSGGSIKPNDLRSFYRRANAAAGQLTDEGLLAMEPTMQELGGSTTGFGYRTLSNMLVGGIGLTDNRANFFKKLGWMGKVKRDSTGRVLGSKFGAVDPKVIAALQHDPESFLQNIVLPAFAKNGITTPEQIQQALIYGFGSTPSNLLYTMYKNMGKTDRARATFKDVAGVNPLFGIAQNTSEGASMRIAAGWHRMALAWGEMTNPTVVKGMNTIASFLESLGTLFFNFHNQSFAQMGENTKANAAKLGSAYHLGSIVGAPLEKKDGFFTDIIKQNPQAKAAAATQTPIHVHVNVDGKKVATAIVPHLSDQISAAGTVSGPSQPNIGMNLFPASYNYSGAY